MTFSQEYIMTSTNRNSKIMVSLWKLGSTLKSMTLQQSEPDLLMELDLLIDELILELQK